MSNVLFLKLAREPNNGLCNQLLSLVSGILHCVKKKKQILVIDKFLTQINSNSYCSISNVFDLVLINEYLKKYNLNIIDGFNINSSAFHPISWTVIELAKKHNNKVLESFIDEIYQNLYFNIHLVNHSIDFITKNIPDYKNKKINVLHVRIEEDGIQHWSRMNNMNTTTFKKTLIDKYINLINDNLKKEDITIILSGLVKNEVVDYMKNNGYNVMFIDKKFDITKSTREINAIIDLIIGKYCNNVFIGCDGSTFSELLYKTISDINDYGNPIKKVMFDLNNI
jgi:hypothetical protein